MASVDAVLFDLDDTLCAYRRSGAELLSLAFETVGVDPFFTVEEYHARYDEHLGTVADMERFRERCFADVAEANGRDPDLGRQVARAYAAERDQTDVEVVDGAREAVDVLGDDHHLGLVTNGPPETQRAKLAATGFDDAFDVEVFAGFDAAAKPDPEPFHRALAPLDTGPGRAVHVGNSLRTDVPGAKRAGLRAAWLREDGADPGDDHRPDYVLDALGDLASPPWA
jgi:HAD superfamily hydrolase (TIGR01549 family)